MKETLSQTETRPHAHAASFRAGADNGTLMSAPYCDYEGYSLMCAYSGGRMAGMYAAEDIEA